MGTIQKQGLINTFIIYIGVALGFINTIVVQPHFLSPDDLALVRIIVNFGGFLTTFLLLGASNTCVKFFASFRDEKNGHHGFLGLILLITLTGIAIGACIFYPLKEWIIARYEGDSSLFVDYFYWEFPLAIVMTLSISLNAYCNSLLKTVFPSFMNDIWVRILLLTFTLIYSFHLVSLDVFVGLIFVTYLSQLTFVAIYIFSIDKPSLRIDWGFLNKTGVRAILRFSLLMALTGLSSLSLKFLDSIMVGAYLPLRFVGIYAIGAFIAAFIETPLYSLERIAGIKIAHGFQENNMKEVKEIYYRSVRVLFLFGGFLTVCIITNIFDFLKLLPAEFHEAAGVTIIMSLGSLINMATGVNSPIINNSSRYAWNMIFLMVLLVATIGLNMLLIPKYGIVGSAVGTGLASTLYNLMKFFFIWKKFGLQPYDVRTLKTLFVILLAFVAAYFIPVPANPWLAMAERGIIIGLIFSGLTYSLKIIPEYNHLLTGKFLKRKR